MIDIHIIPTPGFEEGLAAMVKKLEHPRITVQFGQFVDGNLLEARWLAYNQGNAPYVSFADGDDAVLDISWIDRALHILDNYPHVAAVYPRWCATQVGKPNHVSPIHKWTPEMHRLCSSQPLAHHLTIMRRHQVLELLKVARENVSKMTKNPERYLSSGLARYGQLVSFDDVAYEWRLRPGTARTVDDSAETVAFVNARSYQDAKFAKMVDMSQPWNQSVA